MKEYYVYGDYIRPETKERQQKAKAAAAKVFDLMFGKIEEPLGFYSIKDLFHKPTYYEQWQHKAARRTK